MLARQARMDQRENADSMEPTLMTEAAENADATEPADPMERTDPAEPMDRMDPAEPIDKMDPLEPMLRTESAEPIDHDRRLLVRILAFSRARPIHSMPARRRHRRTERAGIGGTERAGIGAAHTCTAAMAGRSSGLRRQTWKQSQTAQYSVRH